MKHLSAMISAMFLAMSANAADITFELAKHSDSKNIMIISGEIVKGDYAKFKNIITNTPNDKPFLILLDGPGGLIFEAMQIGLDVNKLRYDTVAYKDICASACAYIWLAGERAIIDTDQNAKVGFHSPYYIDKFGNKKSDNSTSAVLGGYLRDIGAGYSVITYATAVDGNGIRWLTESQAKEMGLTAEFYRKKNNSVDKQLPTKTFSINQGNRAATLTITVNAQNQPHGNGEILVNGTGERIVINYVNGVKDGLVIHYYANGNTVFYNYINDVPQGGVRTYLANGQRETWNYVDGTNKGQTWTRTTKEGQVVASGVF
jgi:hypothetical protein